MSLVQVQAEFLLNACGLIQFATSQGFVVTGGELWRPVEMQILYVQQKKSKTMLSSHRERLAIDLNFFKDGVLVGNRKELKVLGDWWEALGPKYRWGGSWRGKVEAGTSTFIDTPHFERQV